jgi:3-hydroxybutyryl-CoA dehydrogenase
MNLLVLGSGKMALDIGAYFLARGDAVAWMTGSPERRDDLARRVTKAARRAARTLGVAADLVPARVAVPDADGAAPDVVIESTREDVAAKREAFARIASSVAGGTLLLSNSSSILPDAIVPRCVGMHFFHPVALTGVVEVVLPAGIPRDVADAARRFAEAAGLAVIEQDERTAFAANRLLLPFQAEVFRALADGVPPAVVDACSVSDLLPGGHLKFLDAVGLDVVADASARYVERMTDADARRCRIVPESLARLAALGKRGDKNGNGLLVGDPLPWPTREPRPGEADALRARLRGVLVDTCRRFLAAGDLDRRALDLVLGSVLGSRVSFDDATAGDAS